MYCAGTLLLPAVYRPCSSSTRPACPVFPSPRPRPSLPPLLDSSPARAKHRISSGPQPAGVGTGPRVAVPHFIFLRRSLIRRAQERRRASVARTFGPVYFRRLLSQLVYAGRLFSSFYSAERMSGGLTTSRTSGRLLKLLDGQLPVYHPISCPFTEEETGS